jgi:NitT/TauT family transport system substrate-binding protein
MRRIATLLTLLAIAATGGVLAGCASITPNAAAGGSGKLGKNGQVDIGYTAIGAAYSDLYVCQTAGVFQKNGLNVKLVPLNTASELLAAISSGSVQVGVGPATATAVGILKGIKLKYIANPATKYYLQIWGKKSIRSPQQLAGHTVAVSSPGGLSDEGLHVMLAKMGLTHKVTVKYLKSIPAEVVALEHGAVDAIVTQPPNGTKTRAFGDHEIMDLTRYPAAANVYTVSDAFIKDNQAIVREFIRSEEQCLAILHTDPKTSLTAIQKDSGTTNRELDLESYRFFRPIWGRTAKVQPGLIKASFDKAAAAQGSKPPPMSVVNASIDNSFIDALTSSGYVKSLYRKR